MLSVTSFNILINLFAATTFLLCLTLYFSLFIRYRQRHIAIQIQYEGEPYYGFTSQTGGCEETVEKHIFEALIKLRLISDRYVSTDLSYVVLLFRLQDDFKIILLNLLYNQS